MKLYILFMPTPVNISLGLSWDYAACLFSTYRVQGACESPSQQTPQGCTSAPPSLTNCKQQFVANVMACSVDDVCAKLVAQGFVWTIQSMQVFNKLPLGGLVDPTQDPNCLIDVTPTISHCNNCCQFLIDENVSTRAGVRTFALGYFAYKATGSMSFSSNFQWSKPVYFAYQAKGNLHLTGNFKEKSPNYTFSVSGQNVLFGNFGVKLSKVYSAVGTMNLLGMTRYGISYVGNGGMKLTSGTHTSLVLGHNGNGRMNVASKFAVVSSSWYYIASGSMTVTGNAIVQNSDLGIIGMESGVTSDLTLTGVTFGITSAPEIVPVNSFVSLPSCCLAPIPTLLTLKHNLGSILSLSNFLLLNQFTLGDISVLYQPRLGVWQGNAHYVGGSPEINNEQQSWDITFEFSCISSFAGNVLPGSVWKISMLLRRKDLSTGEIFIIKLVELFDLATVCSSSGNFDGFSFNFNILNQTTTPTNNGTGIFSDEASLVMSSPAFIANPVFNFQISVANVTQSQTYEFSLESQRNAASHVADQSLS